MDTAAISRKLTDARLQILKEYPFFGRLLMHLRFGLAECETAFTDMKRIVFDPQFAERLTEAEIRYVLIHEVLHCALKHCTRSVGKHRFLYNVACDIVVNSTILEMLETEELCVDGVPMMHLAPDGTEGRTKSAEEIYRMLMKLSLKEFTKRYASGSMDTHAAWEGLEDTTLEDLWEHHLKEAVAVCGVGSGIPQFMKRHLKELDRSPRADWRQILHEFIRYDDGDYDFFRPDKRYPSDILLPSFCEEMAGSRVDRLWFLVDTSGSVSDEAVSAVYNEVKQAAIQIGHVSGMLSFFDYEVSEPVSFDSFEELCAIQPIGGGGTRFHAIFKKLAALNEQGNLPRVMVILTDGYAPFPKEEAALGVPVIWVIVDSDIKPPWGTYAYIGV